MKKEKPKPIAGIYIRSILLPETGEMRYYIGSSKNLERRRKQHKWKTNLPKILLDAYHQYGEKNFTWEVIIQFDDIETKELTNIETDIITVFNTHLGAKLLQINGCTKHSRRRRIYHSGEKKNTKRKPHNGKNFAPVTAYEYSTNALVKEFGTIKEAAAAANISVEMLLFSLNLDEENAKKFGLTINGKEVYFIRKKRKKRTDFSANKKVVCINKITGEETTYETVTAAAEDLNINKFNIGSAASGRLKSAGGYKWKWEDSN